MQAFQQTPQVNRSYTLNGEPSLTAGRGFTGTSSLGSGSYEPHEDRSIERTNPYQYSGSGKFMADYKLCNMPARLSHLHLNYFSDGHAGGNGRLSVYPAWLSEIGCQVVGRFLNHDPIIQNPGFSQSYNRYSYCLNNPFKYTDPSGYNYINYREYWATMIADGSGQGGGGYFMNPQVNGRQNIVGNHWINGYRSPDINFNYMSVSTYERHYGPGSWESMYDQKYGDSPKSGNVPNTGEYCDVTDWVKDGYQIYAVKAFGKTTFVGSFGLLGQTITGTDGGLSFSSATDGMMAFDFSSIPLGGEGMNGLSENDFVKYSIEGTSVWAGTIQTGFDVARKLQPAVKTWVKGAKTFGRASNFLGGVSIAYDFGTGTANSSTILDGAIMIGGAIAIIAGGVAVAPYVAGFGVLYGVSSLFFEKPLNNALDISKSINFIQPRK